MARIISALRRPRREDDNKLESSLGYRLSDLHACAEVLTHTHTHTHKLIIVHVRKREVGGRDEAREGVWRGIMFLRFVAHRFLCV